MVDEVGDSIAVILTEWLVGMVHELVNVGHDGWRMLAGNEHTLGARVGVRQKNCHHAFPFGMTSQYVLPDDLKYRLGQYPSLSMCSNAHTRHVSAVLKPGPR